MTPLAVSKVAHSMITPSAFSPSMSTMRTVVVVTDTPSTMSMTPPEGPACSFRMGGVNLTLHRRLNSYGGSVDSYFRTFFWYFFSASETCCQHAGSGRTPLRAVLLQHVDRILKLAHLRMCPCCEPRRLK